MNMEDVTYEQIYLKVPVTLAREGKYFVLLPTDETAAKFLGTSGFCSQGDSFEQAEEKFWKLYRNLYKFQEKRSNELDKWKPFQKGPWGKIGGKWITIFGLHWSFRYGKGMKGGWYIPFTNLNIWFNNYWANVRL